MSHWFHVIWVFFLYHVVFYWLKKTEKIAVRSTVDLIGWGLRQLFKRRINVNKVIQLGDVGSITVSESAGVASVVVSLNASAGGGQAAGVLKGKASLELDLGAQQVADLAMGLLEAKFPSAAPLLAAAQAEIDNLLKNS